jgi:hypothetical protein
MIDPFYFLKTYIELPLTYDYDGDKKNILVDEQKMLKELNNRYTNYKKDNYLILNVKQLITKYDEIMPTVSLQYFFQKMSYNFICLVEVIKLNTGGIIFQVEPTINEFNKDFEINFPKYNINLIVENYNSSYGKINVIVDKISAAYRNIKIFSVPFNYSHIFTNPIEKNELIPCIYQFYKIPNEYTFIEEIQKHLDICEMKIPKDIHPLTNKDDFLKNKTALTKLNTTLKGFRSKNFNIFIEWDEFEDENIYYLNLEYDFNKIKNVLKLLEKFQFVLIIHIPGMVETISNCFLIPYSSSPPDIDKKTLDDYLFNTFNKYFFEMNTMNKKIYETTIEKLKILYE